MALSKEEAKRLSIISVAEQLGMELKRTGNYSYNWVEHDSFVIDTKKNEFYWNSRTEFGDVIQLVQTIRGVSYKEAMYFLETGEFKTVDVEAQTAPKEPFSYHLKRYERQDFSASRSYLKAQRGLSDDTINFFISQGSIAEAIRKKGDYFEPVIVFKYKDNTGFLAGASLQGIVENREYYPERGRLKQIMRNSDGQLGFSIDIGNPKRLVFAEAPIDLMSYYELHKDRLQDVRLVAMDGVKEGIISRRFMELYAEINDKSYQVNQNTGKALEVVARTTNYFKDGQHQDMITLAVDNDMAGHKFITSLEEKGIPVQIAIPPILQRNQEKEDWNDFLKGGNNTPKELAHVYTVDEKSWYYQGFFEKELALVKAQELTTQDVKAFVSDVQLTKEEVLQEYQTIINQERGRKNSMSKLHENSSEHEEDLVNNHQQSDRIPVQPETQDIIDSGEVKQWIKHPNIYFVKGLRQVALELTEEGKFEQSSQYLPKTEEEKEVVNKLLSKQKNHDEVVLEDNQNSVLNIDTSNLSPEDAEWLKQNWNNIGFSVQSTRLVEPTTASEEKEKSLEGGQETTNNSEQDKKNETKLRDFSEQAQEAAPLPEVSESQPLKDLSPSQTESHSLLYFTINKPEKSIYKENYHPIKPEELNKLNHHTDIIQDAAQWYLDNLSDTTIHYFYLKGDKQYNININFQQHHFMHLTGLFPIKSNQTAVKTLHDFAEGRGEYDNILVSNRGATFQKIKVLPDLKSILETESFYFDQVEDIPKLKSLSMEKAIQSEDKDIVLALSSNNENIYPASLMELTDEFRIQIKNSLHQNVILGIFQEKDGEIHKVDINKNYIEDDGERMLSVLRNKQYEEVSREFEQTIENIRDEFEKTQVKNSQNTLDNPYEKIYQYNRKDERDRDLDGDGISNSDEMLQGTDPYNAASNLHKKQEDRERRTDAEAETGAIITDAIVARSSEQTISQLVANKDTKALAEHLKEGMKNYLDSEQFKSFLDTMSKFHNYSLNNIHLLKMQDPNVSRVASFNKWKADFDRTVKKGSKALKIWVPYQVKTKISANQNELSFSPSENEMEEKEVTVTRFKLGNVFDVSQTEGKELPKAIHELTGDVKDYEDLYRAAKAVSMDNQVSINFEEINRESTNGYYSPDENRIVISKGLKDQEQILKTIFHEMAHADLHRGSNAQYGDDQYRKQELQAESVAYVVANHFGFDTSSYSFGYLAIWAKDKNGFEDMVEQLQVVQKEAKSLIDRMDAKLELVKNKTVTKDKFADKLQQAKEKSEQLGNQKAEVVKQVEEKKSLSSPR